MRILHIGDLHFRKKAKYEQVRIVEALKSALSEQGAIDFVFFSGDLVNNGSNASDFNEAHDLLILPIKECSNLELSNFFVCAGNHDIDRSVIINSIISFFSSLYSIDRKTLEYWYEKQTSDKKASLNSSENFFKYLTSNFIYDSRDEIDVMYSLHIREVSGKKIGIVTLNSSWLCSGERDDKGQLIIPPGILESAINKIRDCDFKILMQHHPLNYIKESILFDLEELIYSNFNVLLVGHVHKEFIETQFRCNNGLYCNTTKASLCNDGGEIGFSILNFDMNDLSTIKIERFHYITSENLFTKLEPVIVTIPLGEKKHKENAIRRKIKAKFSHELMEASRLLLDYDSENDRKFLDNFTDPILSKDSDEQTSASENFSKSKYQDLVASGKNYLIFGKDKCGKTSLLKKIQLDLLITYSTESPIPIYLDYRQLELNDKDINLAKIVSNYYQITRNEAESLISKGNLILLIDNLNTNSSLHQQIISFLSDNLQTRFIICSEYLTSRIFGEELDDLSYDKLFFKNLTRRELRQYTQKISSIKEDDHEVVMERVTNFCKQLHLPLSYWTISLIVLIYQKSRDDYSKNLFSVLDACVDEILMKKKFLFEKTNLKFEQYKSLCAEIASKLFKEFANYEYSCNYADLIVIVSEYKKKNLRIITAEKEIIDFLVECGILKKKIDGYYTYRLNGIFEYFLAYQIKEDPKFKEEILSSPELYLAFRNEIEIYSGFNRSDAAFLKEVFDITKSSIDSFKSNYLNSVDNLLLGRIESAYNFDGSFKKYLLEKPLSDEKRDIIYDQADGVSIDAEVHLKEYISVNELNVEVVERYISILARVLKNSDGITDSKLITNVFDYLLDTYCQYGFYIVDDLEKNAKAENIKIREDFELEEDVVIGEEILKLLSRILPVLIQAMMYEGLGQLNFSAIIESKIRELRRDVENNQYKLFILYFLLMDIDLKKNKALIEDVFEEIRLSPLKVATLFKLNFYLAFKAFSNKPLEEYIKNKLLIAQKRIDSKIDLGDVQRAMSKTTKRNLVRKKNR